MNPHPTNFVFGRQRLSSDRDRLGQLLMALVISLGTAGIADAQTTPTVTPVASPEGVASGWLGRIGLVPIGAARPDFGGPRIELPPVSTLPSVTSVRVDPAVQSPVSLRTEERTETFVTEEGYELVYSFSWPTNSDAELEALGFYRMEERYLLEALQAMKPEFRQHPEFGLIPLDARTMRDEVRFEMLSARDATRRHYYTAEQDRIGALSTGPLHTQDDAGWWRLMRSRLEYDADAGVFVADEGATRIEIPVDAARGGVRIGGMTASAPTVERFVDPAIVVVDSDRRPLGHFDRRAVESVRAFEGAVEREYVGFAGRERIELVGTRGVRNWTVLEREVLSQLPSDGEELWFSETVHVPSTWRPLSPDGDVHLPATIETDWMLGTETDGLVFNRLAVADEVGVYGLEQSDIRYHVEEVGAGAYRVSVVLPIDFLRSDDRVWPVQVDPNTDRYHGLWDDQQGYSYQQRVRTCNWWGWSCSTTYPTGGPAWSNWPHTRDRDFTRYRGFWRWYLPSLFGDWPRVRWINYVDYRSYLYQNHNVSWDSSTYVETWDVYDNWPDYDDLGGGCNYRGGTYWSPGSWVTHRLYGCVNGHVWDRRNTHFVLGLRHSDGRRGAADDLQQWYYDAILYVHFTAWYPDTPYSLWTDDRSTSSAIWGWANGWNPGDNYLEVSGRGTYYTGWGSTNYTLGGFPENYCYAGRVYSCNYYGCSGRSSWATACSRIGEGSSGTTGDFRTVDINYISGERQTMRIDQRNSPRGNVWVAGYEVAVNAYNGGYGGWKYSGFRQDYDNYRVEWAGWNVEPPNAYYIALQERNQNASQYTGWRYEWHYPIPDTPWYMSSAPASTSSIAWSWPNVAYEWGYTVMTSGGSGLVNTGSSEWTEGGLAENSCYSRKVRSYRGNDGDHDYIRAHSYDSPVETGCTRVRDPNSGSFSLSVVDADRVQVAITNLPANHTASSTAVQYQWRACSTCGWQDATGWTSSWSITHTNNQSGGQVFYRVRFRNRDASYVTPWSGERSVLMPLDKDAWEDGDDTSSTNNVISSPTTQANHNLDDAGDVDWYRIPIASPPSLVGVTVLNNTDALYVELCDGTPSNCDGPGGATPTAVSSGYGTRTIANVRAAGSNVWVRVERATSASFVNRYDFRLDYLLPRQLVQNFEDRPGSAFSGYLQGGVGYSFWYGNTSTASSGAYGWLLADSTSSWRNTSLTVRLGLQGVSTIGVHYHSHERPSENLHTVGNHSGPNANGDGVFLSVDNWNWNHVVNAPNSTNWVAGSGGVSGATAFLKFTQYENDAWSAGGRVIDDIEIFADGAVTFGTPGLWTGGCVAGGGNTNWFAGCNWDDGNVPTASVDVTIPAGAPAYPALASTHDLRVGGTASGCDAFARSLTVASGATLTADGQNWYYGDVTIDGTVQNRNGSSNATRVFSGGDVVIGATGRLEASGGNGTYHDLRIESGGAVTNDGGTLIVGDQLWVLAGGTLNLRGGTTHVNYGGVGSTTEKLYVASGALGGFSSGARIHVAPRESSTQYVVLIAESGFSIAEDTVLEINAGGYGRGAANSLFRSDAPIGDLVVNRGGYAHIVVGGLTVRGDVTISSGTLHGDDETIQLHGNWTTNDSFEGGSGRVRLVGAANQAIAGGEGSAVDFNVFEIAKSGGTASLTRPLDTHDLELRSGTLAAGQRVRVSGDLLHLSGFVLSPANWFHFDGGGQSITAANLGIRDVSFEGSGTKVLAGRLFQTQSAVTRVTSGVTLRLPSGATFQGAGSQTGAFHGQIRVEGGTMTLGHASASGVWNSGASLVVAGGLFQAGELDLQNATTTLAGGTIQSTDDLSVGAITMSGGTLENGGGGCGVGRFYFGGSANISGGQLIVNQGAGRGLDVGAAASWSGAPASTIIRGTSIEGSYACGGSHGAAYTMDFDAAGVNLGALSVQSSTIFGDATHGVVASSVVVASSRTLDNVRGTPISVSGNWTNQGSYLPGSGTVTFVGSGASTIVSGGTFHDLTVAKGASSTTLSFGSQTVVAAGSVRIASGMLSMAGSTLRVAGNFTNDDSYRSTGGSWLEFDGSAPSQLRNGSCGTCVLENLRLRKSAGTAGLDVVESSLAVTGAFDVLGGYVDDAVALTVSGATTIQGIAAPARVTVGSAGASLASGSLVVRHGASPSAFVQQNGVTTVAGDLIAGTGSSSTSSGGSTLAISGGVIDVNGTCYLHAGATGPGTSTYAHSSGTLRCEDGVSIAAGGVIAAASNQYGTVMVDGSGASVVCENAGLWLPRVETAAAGIVYTGSAGCSVYSDFAINAGAAATVNSNLTIRGDLANAGSFAHGSASTVRFVDDVASSIVGVGSLNALAVDKAAATYTVTATGDLAVGKLTVTRGDLRFGAGRAVSLGVSSPHLVAASGRLSLLGTAASPVVVRRLGNSGAWTLTVDGTLAASYASIQQMGSAGLDVNGTLAGGVAGTTSLEGVVFRDGASGGAFLDVTGARSGGSATFDLRAVAFEAGTAAYNVRKRDDVGRVTMRDGSGTLWGEQFEDDPNGRVDWAECPANFASLPILAEDTEYRSSFTTQQTDAVRVPMVAGTTYVVVASARAGSTVRPTLRIATPSGGCLIRSGTRYVTSSHELAVLYTATQTGEHFVTIGRSGGAGAYAVGYKAWPSDSALRNCSVSYKGELPFGSAAGVARLGVTDLAGPTRFGISAFRDGQQAQAFATPSLVARETYQLTVQSSGSDLQVDIYGSSRDACGETYFIGTTRSGFNVFNFQPRRAGIQILHFVQRTNVGAPTDFGDLVLGVSDERADDGAIAIDISGLTPGGDGSYTTGPSGWVNHDVSVAISVEEARCDERPELSIAGRGPDGGVVDTADGYAGVYRAEGRYDERWTFQSRCDSSLSRSVVLRFAIDKTAPVLADGWTPVATTDELFDGEGWSYVALTDVDGVETDLSALDPGAEASGIAYARWTFEPADAAQEPLELLHRTIDAKSAIDLGQGLSAVSLEAACEGEGCLEDGRIDASTLPLGAGALVVTVGDRAGNEGEAGRFLVERVDLSRSLERFAEAAAVWADGATLEALQLDITRAATAWKGGDADLVDEIVEDLVARQDVPVELERHLDEVVRAFDAVANNQQRVE